MRQVRTSGDTLILCSPSAVGELVKSALGERPETGTEGRGRASGEGEGGIVSVPGFKAAKCLIKTCSSAGSQYLFQTYFHIYVYSIYIYILECTVINNILKTLTHPNKSRLHLHNEQTAHVGRAETCQRLKQRVEREPQTFSAGRKLPDSKPGAAWEHLNSCPCILALR